MSGPAISGAMPVHVEQIARMRHHHMRGVTAVDGDAERSRRIAHVLVATRAQPAFAAADPRIGRVLLALDGALSVGPGGLHSAGNLMART